MPGFSHALVALTTLAAAAAANPVAKQPDAGGFTLEQVARPARRGEAAPPVASGPWAVYTTHLRYGAQVPAALAAAVAAGGAAPLGRRQQKQHSSTYAANSRNDTEWVTAIEIGTPPQLVHVQADSGSADFWIMGPGANAANHSTYDPAKSTTAETIPGLTWNKTYAAGDFAVGSAVYRDVVKLVDGVVVQQQAVLPATNASAGFLQAPYDGVMGLNLGEFDSTVPASSAHPKNFFQAIKPTLAEPLYGVDFKAGGPGALDFGLVPAGRHAGDVVWVPVNPFPIRDQTWTRWNTTVAGYAFGGAALAPLRFFAIVDTGTTIMYVDQRVVQDLYGRVAGARYDAPSGGWVFPCGAALPDLSFGVDGSAAGSMDKIVTIPGSYLNFSVNDPDKNECFGAVQEALNFQGGKLSILGDAAIKAAYVIFEDARPARNPRVGWASKAL